MSSIIVRGDCSTPGEAAVEHLALIYRYARKSFFMLARQERDHWCEEAVLHFLYTVGRKWKAGQDVVLSMRLLMRPVQRKAHYRSAFKRRHRSQSFFAKHRAAAMAHRNDTVVDVRLALGEMCERDRRILELLGQGWQWQEVEKDCGISVWTISRVRDDLRHRLGDYANIGQPTTGRGRPVVRPEAATAN